MFFSSFQFVLVFLPIVYGGFYMAHRLGGWNWAIHFLAAASFAFYGLFGLKLLAILVCSIAFNYLMGQRIAQETENRDLARKLMFGSITANLVMLGYLKYTNFFIDTINALSGTGLSHFSLFAPIGVSFFTFIQIGYLIDAYNNQLVRHDFARYVLFTAFFPCVTAGPLVMQKEVLQQLDNPTIPAWDLRRVAVGLTMFGLGIFKKTALADPIAPYADTVFNAVAAGSQVDTITAWLGTMCYTLQLYFDFSGYSDMAIGLGMVFGIRLPLNFNSPFKTSNISDFWRNWHMTMTRFFTNYVYTGLAMNGMRKAMTKRVNRFHKFLLTAAIPPVITFLVAGVWHGAGWNFVIYGLVHGLAIATYQAWREFSGRKLPMFVAWTLTMSVVVTGLVIFRSPDVTTATRILASMWYLPGLLQPENIAAFAHYDATRALSFIIILGAITLLLPNTQQVLHLDWPTSDEKPQDASRAAGLLAWHPRIGSAAVTAAIYTIALTSIGSGSNFLYYQF